MSDMLRKCGKGWLITPSETDGEYVPFFLQVRDKDIIWDVRNLNEDFRNLLRDTYNDLVINYPYYNANFVRNNWVGHFNEDLRYSATKTLNVRNNGVLSEDNKTITFSVELPFVTSNDDFNVQLTKNVDTLDIMQSILYKKASNDEGITTIEIELYNMISVFGPLSNYNNDEIYIQVSGRIFPTD